MQSAEIKQHLDKIVLELSNTIPMDFIKENLFIAGGAIRSLVHNETPKDYDFFVKSPEAIEKLKEMDFRWLYKSDNSIGLYLHESKAEVQIIICSSGTPNKVVDEFDFANNANYYDFANDNLYLNNWVYSKQLKIQTTARNLVGTLARIPKFVERGYTLPSVEDLTVLAVRLTKQEPITKLSQLREEARISSCCTENIVLMSGIEADMCYGVVGYSTRGSCV